MSDDRSGPGDESETDAGDAPATSAGVAPDGEEVEGWPVAVRGVTESVVATLGPNDLWNHAALGLHEGDAVTARTWGRTRTRRNFEERGGGHVQFVRDPVDYVEAALGVHETEAPVLASAAAWVEVRVERVDAGTDGGTEWVEWRLEPRRGAVRERTVPTVNRGHAAVVEASVAASRLGVDAFDEEALLDRLSYFEEIVETCGGARDRAAFERIDDLVEWRARR